MSDDGNDCQVIDGDEDVDSDAELIIEDPIGAAPTAGGETRVAVTTSGETRDGAATSGASQNVAAPADVVLDSRHSFRRDASKFHLLIGLTGSVASIKFVGMVSEILRACPENRLLLRAVCTESATHFFDPRDVGFPVYRDAHEWQLWRQRGDPVLHIELRRWADLMLIAPLDANSLAKIANGLCDNLLTSTVRAWDPAKPLYFCPAMNTYMLENPLTYRHLDVLRGLLRFREIPTVEKELVCGDSGNGAMAPLQMIASVIASEVKKRFAVISVS